MNESKTPKIVVGVGLVAVYAGVAFYFLRDRPDAIVVQDAVAQPAPLVDTLVPTPAIAAASADLPTEVAAQPAVATGQTAVAIEAPSPPPRAVARTAAPEPRSTRVQPRVETRVVETPVEEPAQSAAPGELSQESTVASTVDDPASAAADLPSPVQEGSAPSGTDSQITADVRTQIAAVAPTSDIEVTTTDGVVELSGSVPSHEDVNKVLVAARSVEHVRGVEASALMVAN